MVDGSHSKSKWVVRVVEAPPALCIVGVSSSVQRSQAIERCPSKCMRGEVKYPSLLRLDVCKE